MKLHKFTTGVLVLTGLSLGGCVSQQQVTAAPAVPPVAPRMAVLPPGPRIFERTVAAGTTAKLDFASNVNPDCGADGLPAIRVLQQPMHGKAVVSERDDYPSFPPNNLHFHCNKEKVHGVSLEYTPDNNFTGYDFLIFETIFPNGMDHISKLSLNIK